MIVDGSRLLPALLTPPPSKSDAIRALVLTDILGLPMPERREDTPRDVHITADGLRALHGGGPREIDCYDGGAPFRILLGQAALRSGETRFSGTARLGERPHEPLIEALVQTLGPAGLTVHRGNPWPLTVFGAEPGSHHRLLRAEPSFRAAGAQSSQFATSLLLAAARLTRSEQRTWTVELVGPEVSEGYVALTLEWLGRAGFACSRNANLLTVAPGAARSRAADILSAWPADWSAAAILLVVAWRSGGRVARLDPDSQHPDRAVLNALREVGLSINFSSDGSAEVRGVAARGVSVSAARSPDLVPALAALASVLPSPSMFTDVHLLRAKESDRLDGLLELLAAAGVPAATSGDVLRVERSPAAPRPFRARSFGDHRLAMAAACLAILLGTSVELDDAACVSKSFPLFFAELRRTGAIS